MAAPEGENQDDGRYDFDLAEFPLFRFYKNRVGEQARAPLTYQDTILGKDGVPVRREWTAHAGPFGFGGPSTHVLFYDLLQLYVEQGCSGSYIHFGTLRALFQRRGDRNPSQADYRRLRRDIDILRGYDFHCKNAFWDPDRQAYVDMNWRLFGAVFYFKEGPSLGQLPLPFGCLEVSPVLKHIASKRGFFALGFASALFHQLRPLEQRLAVYLAKKFISQKLHRRYVDDLAQALPIEAARPDNTRAILKTAASGLLAKKLPILKSFALEKSRGGRWVVVFHRGDLPRQDRAQGPRAEEPDPATWELIERIIEATGNADDHLWWAQCARRMGQGGVDRALGQLKEAARIAPVRNRGALLTKIFKDLADEYGIAIR